VNIVCFFGGGFAKDQEIINKKEVMDGWGIYGDFKPFDVNSNLERTSVPKINRKGERESPCRRPLLRQNRPKGLPLIRMEKEEEKMHNLIQLIQEGWKPNFFITNKMNSHSILSKAFSMSILRNMKPPFPFLFLKECSSS
jgi:hypothetical protein